MTDRAACTLKCLGRGECQNEKAGWLGGKLLLYGSEVRIMKDHVVMNSIHWKSSSIPKLNQPFLQNRFASRRVWTHLQLQSYVKRRNLVFAGEAGLDLDAPRLGRAGDNY